MDQGAKRLVPFLILYAFIYLFLICLEWKEYTDKVYSNSSSSVLPLRGNVGEVGNYACQWNNSLGEIKFKEFNITFEDSGARSTDAIILVVTLVILLLITVFIGVKLYSNKVKAYVTIIDCKRKNV